MPNRNCPVFDPSILRHSGIWGVADEAVNRVLKKFPSKYLTKTWFLLDEFLMNSYYRYLDPVLKNLKIAILTVKNPCWHRDFDLRKLEDDWPEDSKDRYLGCEESMWPLWFWSEDDWPEETVWSAILVMSLEKGTIWSSYFHRAVINLPDEWLWLNRLTQEILFKNVFEKSTDSHRHCMKRELIVEKWKVFKFIFCRYYDRNPLVSLKF